MNTIKTALSCLLVAIAAPAFASTISLDFENAPSTGTALVGNTYSALGIVFSDDAYLGGAKGFFGNTAYGNFKGPGATPDKGAVTLTSDPNRGQNPNPPALATSFTINVTAGFSGEFSMIFTGRSGSAVSVAAVDKAGNILKDTFGADLTADGTAPAECTSGVAFCNWESLVLDMDGIDVSYIQISGVDGQQWFDNMKFTDVGDVTPPGDLPEPGGVALSMAALGALAWTRKRFGGKAR